MEYKEIEKLNEYQKIASTTDCYPKNDFNIMYKALGLTGEAGEVADKIKKVYRDRDGKFTDEDRRAIAKELGDVLWYLSQIALNLGYELNEIANVNIIKLKSRQERNLIHGEGDNR